MCSIVHREKTHTVGDVYALVPRGMLDADALERLASELWDAEWRRVRQVRIWSLFADCRERELHKGYGWSREVVMWAPPLPHARENRHGRHARRAWYLRMRPAQRRAAAAKWETIADGGHKLRLLAQGVEDILCELHTYNIVRESLEHRVPPELVHKIWEQMDMDDAWEQLDAGARCFLWRMGSAHVVERTPAPWQHGWWRNAIRRRWTALVFQLRQCCLEVLSCGGFWQGQELGYWDVLTPWRAGYHVWRVHTRDTKTLKN